MRSRVMVGFPVWVRLVMRSTLSTGLGPRRPMVVVGAGDASTLWCLVCVARAGYSWCACWRGCVDGGGLSACLPVESVPALGFCLCVWWWRRGSVRWALGGRGWVRVLVFVYTWCGLRGVCGRRVCCCPACGGLCCLVERGRAVLCVDGVGPGRRGWCRCGCLGMGAGCGRVVRAVWSGVMVVSLATSMVTVLQVISVGRRCWRLLMWVLWVVLKVGVLQVWCRVDGGVPGDGVVSAVRGEGVVGDALGGGAAGERLAERRGRYSAAGRDGGFFGVGGQQEVGAAGGVVLGVCGQCRVS